MRLILLLGFFLFACEKTDPWLTETIRFDDPETTITRIFMPTKDPVKGLDLEVFINNGCAHLFVNIHSFETTPYEKDASLTSLQAIIGTEEHLLLAQRLEGGQRLSFDERSTRLLISALKENKKIHLILDGYEAHIQSSKSALTALQMIAYDEEKRR